MIYMIERGHLIACSASFFSSEIRVYFATLVMCVVGDVDELSTSDLPFQELLCIATNLTREDEVIRRTSC